MDQHIPALRDVGRYESQVVAIAPQTPIASRRRIRLRPILLGAVALALAAAGLYGRYWWTNGRFLIATDDAYVQADNVIISPKISGYLSAVLVADNQHVRAGWPRCKQFSTRATWTTGLARPSSSNCAFSPRSC